MQETTPSQPRITILFLWIELFRLILLTEDSQRYLDILATENTFQMGNKQHKSLHRVFKESRRNEIEI